MEQAKFWEIIDKINDEADTLEERNSLLTNSLSDLELRDIFSFYSVTKNIMSPLWNDSDFIEKLATSKFVFSDDSLECFIYWLISQGKETFDKIVANPSLLREMLPKDTFLPGNEDFNYVPSYAYEKKRVLFMEDESIAVDDEFKLLFLMEEEFHDAYYKTGI